MRLNPTTTGHLAAKHYWLGWGGALAVVLATLWGDLSSCLAQELVESASGDVVFESETAIADQAPASPESESLDAAQPRAVGGPPNAPTPAGPDTTIWIDDKGQPRPVIGMTYDDLQRAWRALQDLEEPSDAPRFVREELTLEGKVLTDRVEFTLRCRVRLPTGKRIAVPLGLAGSILASYPLIDGQEADDQFIAYDKSSGGYVAWLDGKPGDTRLIELSLIRPLELDGDRTVFRSNLPRASKSKVVFDCSQAITEPFTSPGALLESTATPGGVKLTVEGAVGDFQLGWREPAVTASRQPNTVLSVEGQVFIDIDGRSVRSEATLKIQSYGAQLERFRVRLPVGATLIPPKIGEPGDPQPRFTPIIEDPTEGASSKETPREANEGPLWLVTLPQPTSEPATVKLVTDQLLGLDDQSDFDLAGFEVLDAVRQYGDVAIRVGDDWRLRWGDTSKARRIDIGLLPAELQQRAPTAAVRYFRQPWSSRVQIELLSKRVEATPRYRLEILPDEAVLHTTISYRIRGARVSAFTIDLQDWDTTADPLEPVGLVDEGQSEQNIDGTLSVALKDPATRNAEIGFVATRDLSTTDKTVELRLPIAEANSLGASELIVVVDPSLRLTPDPAKSQRLRAAPLRAEDRDPADPTGLRTFRFRGFLPDQLFVAEKQRRPGELEVAIESQFTVNESETEVVQDFGFDARYEAIESIQFVAPADLVKSGVLQLDLLPTSARATERETTVSEPAAGLPLVYQSQASPEDSSGASSDESLAEADDSLTTIQIALPRPWLGPFTIRAAYQVEGGLREINSLNSTSLGLLTAVDASQQMHRAVARASNGAALSLDVQSQGWVATERLQAAAEEEPGGPLEASSATRETTVAELQLETDLAAQTLVLGSRPTEAPQSAGAVLRFAWWQSWYGFNKVQQRAVFRIDTTGDRVVAELPESASGQEVEVFLDGKPYSWVERSGGQLTVRLTQSSTKEEPPTVARADEDAHILELRYFDSSASNSGSNSLAWRPVRLIADDALTQSYWQVILPATEHVIEPPQGLATAMQWNFEGGVWGRRPLLSTPELEDWIGATDRGGATASEHSYLFSFYGPPPVNASRAISTIGRRNAVVGCSGLLLAIGLAIIYLPVLRSPSFLLAMVLLTAAVGALFPGPFLVVAQAGVAGLLLAALAAVLAAVLQTPSTPETRLSGSSILKGDSLSLEDLPTSGADDLMTLPLGSVSTNAPTVSIPPHESNG